MNRVRSVALASLVSLCCAALAHGVANTAGAAPRAGKPAAGKGKKKDRPNIVVVMTDDQDQDSMRFMPHVQRLIGERGVTFDNSIVTNSFCCPSRATFLTGQYSKNHGVLSNEPPYGGYANFQPGERNSLSVWLQKAGYATSHIGRYLQGYKTDRIPPGWSEWYASLGLGAFNYTLNVNGKPRAFGGSPADYETDALSDFATSFIGRRARSKRPFFLFVGPFAPHAEGNDPSDNPRPAPRHDGLFDAEPLPKPPNWNEADISDKPRLTSGQAPIPKHAEDVIENMYRDRLESLQAVDEMVAKIVASLGRAGELKNTVIFFTSDNGFLQGHHRWRTGKVLPYEESLRVPLLVAGPGFPAGQHRDQLVANVDLAPTIVDLAGATARRPADGRSLRTFASEPASDPGRGIYLEGHYNEANEYGPGPRIVFTGVRTDRYMYAVYETGEEELYDLALDPYELQNLHDDPVYAQVKAALIRLKAGLAGCRGSNCQMPPALGLRVRHRRGKAGCVASAVGVRLRGRDLGEVLSADLYLRGRARGPLSPVTAGTKLPAKRLRKAKAGTSVRLDATLLDGRTVSLDRVLKPRC